MINAAQVGFGAAVLAGVVLAIIGHPGPKDLPPARSAVATAAAAPAFVLKSVLVELPTSDITFPGGAAADAINANCLSCHSAGMVLTQPNLAKATWAAEVDKMIHTSKRRSTRPMRPRSSTIWRRPRAQSDRRVVTPGNPGRQLM